MKKLSVIFGALAVLLTVYLWRLFSIGKAKSVG